MKTYGRLERAATESVNFVWVEASERRILHLNDRGLVDGLAERRQLPRPNVACRHHVRMPSQRAFRMHLCRRRHPAPAIRDAQSLCGSERTVHCSRRENPYEQEKLEPSTTGPEGKSRRNGLLYCNR